uniref:PNPLA domain-containing protein n=1 Tax=viral metagenome TaxID=1070528 RepID=A0A6C0EC14_9ZZZZ
MDFRKLGHYFGFWKNNPLVLETETTPKTIEFIDKDKDKDKDIDTDIDTDLDIIEQIEIDEISDFEKGTQLETGEYMERGIIFSKKPYLNTTKYKKQISVGGTGGLMNYMIGIIQIIKENFDLDDCIVTGVSGGCLSAFLLITPKDKIKIDDFLDHSSDYLFCQEFLNLLSDSIVGCNGRVNSSFHIIWNKIIEHYFPNPDTREEEILNIVRDRLYISTTKIGGFKNFIINNWDNVDDLIESVLSSMTIPVWSQLTITRSYKNYWLFDGFFSNSTPQIFLQMPTLNLECLKWRNFRYIDFYPSYKYEDHSKLKKLGMLDALEHLEDLERFFGQTAKCRKYLSDPNNPFNQS